jgi:hypothetical protein
LDASGGQAARGTSAVPIETTSGKETYPA